MKCISLCVLFFFFWVQIVYATTFSSVPKDFSRWMKKLADTTLLCKISIPGTHDSGCFNRGGCFIRTQDIDIATQLKSGIRFFDIRLQAMKDGRLGIYHSFVFQDIYFEEHVLPDFIRFLQNNPSEVLIVSLKKENGELADYMKLLSAVLEKAEFEPYFVRNFHKDLTLGECRGKIIFMHREYVTGDFGGVICVGWKDNATSSLIWLSKDGSKTEVTLEDEYQYSSARKSNYKIGACIRNINKIAEVPYESRLWGITFVSATAVPICGPLRFAKRVNAPVAGYIQNMNKKNCGIVVMDFAGREHGRMLIDALIDSNW